MESKKFNNERDARIFRDLKRSEGLAASLFTYGKDRYRVKVMEINNESRLGWTQQYLSNQAYDLSQDIEDLSKMKDLIANPDFGYQIEDAVFVAKKLDKEHWFSSPKSVIDFFDGISEKELAKIKEMVDTALKEHEDDWNEN